MEWLAAKRAVREAYVRAYGEKGTPLVFLSFELPPDRLDVNVHPTKETVRPRPPSLSLWVPVWQAEGLADRRSQVRVLDEEQVLKRLGNVLFELLRHTPLPSPPKVCLPIPRPLSCGAPHFRQPATVDVVMFPKAAVAGAGGGDALQQMADLMSQESVTSTPPSSGSASASPATAPSPARSQPQDSLHLQGAKGFYDADDEDVWEERRPVRPKIEDAAAESMDLDAPAGCPTPPRAFRPSAAAPSASAGSIRAFLKPLVPPAPTAQSTAAGAVPQGAAAVSAGPGCVCVCSR